MADTWDTGVAGRLGSLAAARAAAQVLGAVWFLVAARALTPAEFGVMTGALAVVVVLGALGDLGTTRTVVRHVASDTGALRPAFRRGAAVRVAAGVVCGVVATAALSAGDVLPAGALALAAWIAVASGTNEVGYAALRSVGDVRGEVRLLLLERTSFTVMSAAAVSAGAGPLVVLALYGATNTVTAVLAATRIAAAARRHPPTDAPTPYLDAEGRRTALVSALVIAAPRVSSVVLVIAVGSAAVGSLAAAQKPAEALSLLGVAMLLPTLPVLRSRLVRGQDDRALAVGAGVASAVLLVSAPLIAWFLVEPVATIELLYGDEERAGASTALLWLAVACAFAIVRTLGELLALAGERAASYLGALVAGVAATTVLAIPLSIEHGPAGAAFASLAGEVVTTAVVWRRRGGGARWLAAPAASGTATAVVLLALRPVGQAAQLAALVVVAAGSAAVARARLAAADEPDVGAEPRGDDRRQPVEPLE